MVRTPNYQEQLAEGLLYQKYAPHIHSFTFSDMKDETIDIAFEKGQTLDKHYVTEGLHIQYLYVLEDVKYTPYVFRRVKEAVDTTPETLRESTAIVADTFLAKLLETILVSKMNLQAQQAVRFFSIEAEAFAWFEERRKAIGD